jgi:hypothetical protein
MAGAFACDHQKGPSIDEQIFHVEAPSNRKKSRLEVLLCAGEGALGGHLPCS